MSETYGELVTSLCQLRDQMRTTAPGRQALGSIRDQLDVMARASRAAGGVPWALTAELERVKAERDAAVDDLRRAASMYHFCDFCGRRGCVDAIDDSLCKMCRRQSNYSWRGGRKGIEHETDSFQHRNGPGHLGWPKDRHQAGGEAAAAEGLQRRYG